MNRIKEEKRNSAPQDSFLKTLIILGINKIREGDEAGMEMIPFIRSRLKVKANNKNRSFLNYELLTPNFFPLEPTASASTNH